MNKSFRDIIITGLIGGAGVAIFGPSPDQRVGIAAGIGLVIIAVIIRVTDPNKNSDSNEKE